MMEEGVKTKPTQDSIKLLMSILEERDPETRKQSYAESHTFEWIRKQKPWLTKEEAQAEYEFMQSGKIGIQEFDEKWGTWNWHRVRLEGILRSMLKNQKFRREQIVKAEMANLAMEYCLFEAIRKMFLEIRSLKMNAKPPDLSYVDDMIPAPSRSTRNNKSSGFGWA